MRHTSTITYLGVLLLAGAVAAQMQVSTGATGGLVQHGQMFDMRASPGQDLRILGLDCHLSPGPHLVELWTRQGSYVGHEHSSAGWRLVGEGAVTCSGLGELTPLPFPIDVVIRRGETQAFFLHSDLGLRYETGTAVGAVAAQDWNLAILEGAAGAYFDMIFSPRIWNGRVHYESGPFPLVTEFTGSNGFNGNMFDVVAIGGENVRITSLEANLAPGTGLVEIWTRPGTHVGHESSSAGWTRLGGVAVESPGYGIPTAVPLQLDVIIPAGETQAFYLHNDNPALPLDGVRYSDGTAVGAVAATDGVIAILEGHGGDYFDVTFAPRVFNGIVHHDVSPQLTTSYAAGNGHECVMFDLVASPGREVTVLGLDAHLQLGSGDVEVWTRPSTHVGHEHSSSGWVRVFLGTRESAGMGRPVHVALDTPVTIGGGQTQAFCVFGEMDVYYTTGTALGAVAAADANLSLLEGSGGPYFDCDFTPRVYNGTVYYDVDQRCASTGAPGGNGADGNMFDVVASGGRDVTVLSMAGHLAAPSGVVEIYTRAGSHVGHETDPGAWTLLGSAYTESRGLGELTPLPIPLELVIPSGAVQGFYVTVDTGVRYTNGSAVGAVAVETPDLQILEGHGGDLFDVTYAPRVWNGTICYTAGLCSGICGDCNLDGMGPSIVDALTAAQIASGLIAPSLFQLGCCDVDSSSTIAIIDALLLAQHASGLPAVLVCP